MSVYALAPIHSQMLLMEKPCFFPLFFYIYLLFTGGQHALMENDNTTHLEPVTLFFFLRTLQRDWFLLLVNPINKRVVHTTYLTMTFETAHGEGFIFRASTSRDP